MSNPTAFIAVSAGSNAAIVAAIAAKRRREKEEEQMVQYNADDLKGWEFKIVRSNTATFRNHEKVQQVVAEEAKAGWELLEKFDDHRLRFKRRVERRTNDQFLQQDPYRTQVGSGAFAARIAIVAGVVLALAGLGLTIFFFTH